MNQSEKPAQGLDTELLILVPIFTLGLLVNAMNLWSSVDFSDASGTLTSIQRTLTVLFYVLAIVLLLVRKPSKSSTSSWWATWAAYAGSFCPFLLVLNGRPSVESEGLTAVSVAVMTLGMCFSVYSLARLGRSFGVVPRARDLVRTGPYRFVRHPLYVGEIVWFGGAVIGVLSVFSTSLLLVLILLQTYRATQEEKVLQEVFPEYASYKEQAGRFVPRLVRSA